MTLSSSKRRDGLDVLLASSLRRYEYRELTDFLAADTQDVSVSDAYRQRRNAVIARFAHPMRTGFRKFTHAAAILLICLISVALITVMSVSALREAVFEAISDWYDQHVAVFFADTPDETDDPTPTESDNNTVALVPNDEITEARSPLYRPQGVEAHLKTDQPRRYYVDYYKDDSWQYSFCQEPLNDRDTSFEAADATVTAQAVGGYSGILVTYEDGYSLLWSDEQYNYRLDTNLSLTQTMLLANSVGDTDVDRTQTPADSQPQQPAEPSDSVKPEAPADSTPETTPETEPETETEPAVTHPTAPPTEIIEYKRPTYLSGVEYVYELDKSETKYWLAGVLPGGNNLNTHIYEYHQGLAEGMEDVFDSAYVSQIVDINGNPAALIDHTNYVSLIWEDGQYVYSLSCYMGKDLAIQLATSVSASPVPKLTPLPSNFRRMQPTYVPTGVSADCSVVNGAYSHDVIYYQNGTGSNSRTVSYFYSQTPSSGSQAFLSADCVTQTTKINGHTAAVIQFEETGPLCLMWDDGTYLHMLKSHLDLTQTVRVAESVREKTATPDVTTPTAPPEEAPPRN